MQTFLQSLGLLVVFFGFINLIRMSAFLVGSDLYNLLHHIKKRRMDKSSRPTVSVVIPAYNEEANIIQCVQSVFNNNYPRELFEIIVIDDGSTDSTVQLLKEFKKKNTKAKVQFVSQKSAGKAHALNLGMKKYAKGELVMCLDSDSQLHPEAIKRAVSYFEDPKVMALASNVKIQQTKGILNLIQLFEYLICHQMKRAQTIFNIEYIIGGIGSTFRKSYLEYIDYYDSNTVTEDIDITMKILKNGNRNVKILFAHDVISYTQSVLTIPDLVRQRFRWKWGRYQTFLKNKHMFFSLNTNFSFALSWIYLPYALFSDIAFFLEPLLVLYIVSVSILYQDFFTLISAFSILTFYTTMNIVAEDTIEVKTKIKLILLAPVMYFFFYILSYVEYIALIKSLLQAHTLKNSLGVNTYNWKPVKRLRSLEYR